MALPTKNARQRTQTRPTQAPQESTGRTASTGAEPREGSARAETGARGQGFGLATGGGPGSGSTLDVGDFCCPDYLVLMVERIRSAWNQNQGTSGQCVVKFTIQRNGSIANATVERTSGASPLDLAALRAVVVTKTLPPLPDQFPNPTLTVHLNFEYR
jgi:TonB family protein